MSRYTWQQRHRDEMPLPLTRPKRPSADASAGRLDNQSAQRQAASSGTDTRADLAPMVRRLAELPAQPLGAGERAGLPPAVHGEAAQARLHTGPEAAAMAEGLGAKAFTAGRHVAFGTGQFRSGSAEGDRLIAHELAHVRQHGAGGADGSPPAEARLAAPDSAAEVEAARLAQGGAASPAAARGGAIFRDEDKTSTRDELMARFRSAVQYQRWGEAAVILNGFNDADIALLLGELSPRERERLRNGAAQDMPGWHQRVTGPIERMAFGEMEQARVDKLKQDYAAAVQLGHWDDAAVL